MRTSDSPLIRPQPRRRRRAVTLWRDALIGVAVLVAGCDASTAPILDLPPAPGALDARPGGPGSLGDIQYVVHVSIDGLRPDAVERFSEAEAPAFARLRQEGTYTHNARTDVDFRHTLPNHIAQITGRPVLGSVGHGWTENGAPASTIHANRGTYVASVFDVAHDHGLRTAAYTSKSKFSLIDQSYDDVHGAPDTTGDDNGTDKIDVYVHHLDTEALTDRLVSDLRTDPSHYTFLHLHDPDAIGHEWGWSLESDSPYLHAVQRIDARIGDLMAAVESSDRLRGKTALVMTADHGGSGTGHYSDRPSDYTIPLYVWGPGIGPGDLYAVNGRRSDPGSRQPSTVASPIRNGDAANLSLSLLTLPPIPGSTLGADAPLRAASH